jgi:hypothetical protein
MLVSVVKRRPCLRGIRKAAFSCAFFFMAKELTSKDIHKEMFTVGNIYHVKRFITWLRNSLKDVWKSPVRCGSGRDNRQKTFLCSAFGRTGKAIGQVYQCWWRICREINVTPRLRPQGSHILRFMSICDLFTDSPSYVHIEHVVIALHKTRFVTYSSLRKDVYLQHSLSFHARSLTWFQIFLAAIWNSVFSFSTFPFPSEQERKAVTPFCLPCFSHYQ